MENHYQYRDVYGVTVIPFVYGRNKRYGKDGVDVAAGAPAWTSDIYSDLGVTPSFFRVMGTPPMLGRTLAGNEEGSHAPAVVVVRYAFWRTRLSGDPHAVGRKLVLDRAPHTIIGVMPQGYDYPKNTDIWQPLAWDESSQRPRSVMRPLRVVNVLARLKPGITRSQMDSEMVRLTQQIHAEYPPEFDARGFTRGMAILAVPLHERISGDLRKPLLALAAAGVYGVMSYLVARRNREIAIRMAMGARPTDVMQMVFRESMALIPVAVLAGLAGAWALTRFVRTMLYGIAATDAPTFLITPLILAVVVVAASLGPARRAATVDPMTALREE